jgi:stearoyl-CoA desaturase (delta-9 desaturase)
MALASRLAWYHRIGLPIFHLAALASLTVVPSRGALILFVGSYCARVIGITAGYHRLFTHRAYTASRPLAFVLGFCGGMAGQGPMSRWVHHHWKHHRFVDQEGDLHSPRLGGFWHAHIGWLFLVSTFEDELEARKKQRRRWPVELQWLDRAIPVLLLLLAVVLYAIGGVQFLAWGYFIPMVMFWHVTFFANSLSHWAGRRMFETADDSRNNPILSAFLLGDGWHNNHHAWPRNARLGLRFLQPDPTFWFIKSMEMLGLAWNVTERSESDVHASLSRREVSTPRAPRGSP